jgi:hypothetical protein
VIGHPGKQAILARALVAWSGQKVDAVHDHPNRLPAAGVHYLKIGGKKMKQAIVDTWNLVMDSSHNPLRHLDLASQHYFMQVLGWMWSMVFSLSFLSIYQFGFVWLAHLLVFGGIAMTVAVFREAERQALAAQPVEQLSSASRCVWKLDTEA